MGKSPAGWFGGDSRVLYSFHRQAIEEGENEEKPDPFADERGLERQAFLPADIFEKTKAQREAEAG